MTVVLGVECMLAADKRFLQDIHLENSGIYEPYAERMRDLGRRADARQITLPEYEKAVQTLRKGYVARVDAALARAK